MSSPRNPGFEEAVEVLAEELAKINGFASVPGTFRMYAASMLTALLDAKQTETCPTCGGTGKVADTSSPITRAPDNRASFRPCGCTDGRAPGTVPLIILGPTLAHPTVKIPNDVPGWEGVTLPAAYHDPLRDGEFQ